MSKRNTRGSVDTTPAGGGASAFSGGRANAASVKNLQELYTVAVGIALAWGIEQLLGKGTTASGREVPVLVWASFPGFLAFLVTLVPFYHGALRHLDTTYVDADAAGVRSGSLLADFFLLFIEACFLVLAAKFVPEPRTLGAVLAGLFILDAFWGIAVYLVFTKPRRRLAQLQWVLINLIAGPLLAGCMWLAPLMEARYAGVTVYAVLAIAALRTTVDYFRSWRFYFPEEC